MKISHNQIAYREGQAGRQRANPYPVNSGPWRSWNLGRASQTREVARPMKKNPSPPRQKAQRRPYYVVKEGKKFYHATVSEAAKFAQRLADATGLPVKIHEPKRPTKTTRRQ